MKVIFIIQAKVYKLIEKFWLYRNFTKTINDTKKWYYLLFFY